MATVEEALALALDHHLAGRLDEAEELYGRILDAVSDLPDALHLLGVLTGQRGRTAMAERLIAQAIAGNPAAADYRINLADLLRRTGRLREALHHYRDAYALAPHRGDVVDGFALTAARLGGLAEGSESAAGYRCALALKPDDAEVLVNLAVCHHGGDGEILQRGLGRAGRLEPDADMSGRRAILLEEVGRLEEAVRATRAALMLTPERPEAWSDFGRRLRAAGDEPAAATALERAVLLSPQAPAARALLGMLRLDRGEASEAARHFRAALAADPDQPRLRSALWEAERALGHHAQYCSHEGQDAFVHRTFFPDLTGGVFLDIGAYDGVIWSNTLFFERSLGWTGLCVEASPARFAELVNNRPGPCLNVALSDREGIAEFLDIVDGPLMMGGLAETFTPRQRAFVESMTQEVRTIPVPVRRLDRVLAEHGISHVHYCSIDTEGAERRIVESIDFARVTIDVFSLEINQTDPEFRSYLSRLGYDFVCRFDGGDEIFARRGLPRW